MNTLEVAPNSFHTMLKDITNAVSAMQAGTPDIINNVEYPVYYVVMHGTKYSAKARTRTDAQMLVCKALHEELTNYLSHLMKNVVGMSDVTSTKEPNSYSFPLPDNYTPVAPQQPVAPAPVKKEPKQSFFKKLVNLFR